MAWTAFAWNKSYVYAGSRLLSTVTKSGSTEVTEYQHPDRLGTKLITNTANNTQREQATLPFGTEIPAETTGTSNQRFTSYDRSGTTGLDYAVNRTYNSGQSRFTQVDPIGMASASAGDPQSLNLFAYVGNNPVDFVDPSGLIAQGPGMGCARGYLTRIWYGSDNDGYTLVVENFVCFVNGSVNVGGSVGGVDETDDLTNLANDFKNHLNRRNCRQNVNNLLQQLGNKENVEDFADKFLNGTYGKQTVFGNTSSVTSSAEYYDNTITIEPRGNPFEPESWKRNANVNNFRHELFHAANNKKIGLSHENIAEAINKVDDTNFKVLKSQVDAQAKAAKKAAKSSKEKFNEREFKEGRYSRFMNIWLEKECGPEKNGGKDNG